MQGFSRNCSEQRSLKNGLFLEDKYFSDY